MAKYLDLQECTCNNQYTNMISVKHGQYTTIQYTVCYKHKKVRHVGNNLCSEGMSIDEADELTEGYKFVE